MISKRKSQNKLHIDSVVIFQENGISNIVIVECCDVVASSLNTMTTY